MIRRIPWTAPIAAIIALASIERIITTGDLWLGFTLASLAAFLLILPARTREPADSASTALPPLGGTQPAAGVIEATPAAPAER